MQKVLFVLVGCLVAGAALARWGVWLPVRPGLFAAALLIAAAWGMRAYWARRQQLVGDDPAPTERNLWVYLAGTAVIVGYVVVVLMTPGAEVHTRTGDTGGLDSWLMLGGGVVAWWLLYEPNAPKDERDLAIAALGDRVGYWALALLLIGFLLFLGFAPYEYRQRFTHWLIANALLSLIMCASLVQYTAQLLRYAREQAMDYAGAGDEAERP